MNCTGNCNQGRNCDCMPKWPRTEADERKLLKCWEKQSTRQSRLQWIEIAIGMVLLVVITTLTEQIVTGTVYWMPTVWGGTLALVGAAYLLGWMAEKIIDGIDFMTRWED